MMESNHVENNRFVSYKLEYTVKLLKFLSRSKNEEKEILIFDSS